MVKVRVFRDIMLFNLILLISIGYTVRLTPYLNQKSSVVSIVHAVNLIQVSMVKET